MSRLSRVKALLERAERVQQDRARTLVMIRDYEIGQLVRGSVPVDDLIELSREIHSGNRDAETRLLEHVAEATARWENGARPGGDRAVRELIDREQNAARRRLGDLRH